MNDNKIAVRYAKAFFEVGQEKFKLSDLREDIEIIAKASQQKEIQLLLESPVVKTKQKKELFTEIFKESIQQISLNFLLMVIENKRENYIPAICRNFIDRYRKFKGIKAAKVTTAVIIDEQLKAKISNVISEVFKSDVELVVEENSDLIGGFILRVGDQQIDASVATKLRKIKREFLDTTV